MVSKFANSLPQRIRETVASRKRCEGLEAFPEFHNRDLLLCSKLFMITLRPLVLFLFFSGAFAQENATPTLKHKTVCTVKIDALNENSGIAPSFHTLSAVLSHYDSGCDPVLYLFSLETGESLATIKLSETLNLDWEDITSFVWNGVPYLAIADFGDNLRKRREYQICLLKEPELPPNPESPTHFLVGPEDGLDLRFRYEDRAHNCEALAYDPLQERFLLLTKDLSQ